VKVWHFDDWGVWLLGLKKRFAMEMSRWTSVMYVVDEIGDYLC
jgi:hypothetical protein